MQASASRPGRVELVDRRRDPGAAFVAVAAAVFLLVLALSGDGGPDAGAPDRTDPEPTDDGADEPAQVTALRDGPWLESEVGILAVVTAIGGRMWVVDVAGATITERHVDIDGRTFTPIGDVVDGHVVSQWGGRVQAVPLAGGAVIDVGVADEHIPRPVVFPSERADAFWTIEPAAAENEVVAVERTVGGQTLRTTAGTFPLFSAPIAAVGGGLLVPGLGGDVNDLEVVDVATGARRFLTESTVDGTLVAAGGDTVVVTDEPCDPGCPLTIVDVPTGQARRVPAADGAGVRTTAGSVSPDGATLVHAVSTTRSDDPRPHYVVTDLAAGRSRLTDVPAGPGVAWSPDGRAFLAAPGNRERRVRDTRLVVHHVASGETEELPVLVRVPSSQPWAVGG